MLFGDTRVAAVTDLPSHLQSLAGNTGLIRKHWWPTTPLPLPAPFILWQRRFKLHQSMLPWTNWRHRFGGRVDSPSQMA